MTKPISNSVAINRRDVLKALMLAPLAGSLLASSGCAPSATSRAVSWTSLPKNYSYARTDAEKQRDAELFAETFFREHELLTLAVLCDIILPSNHENGGALAAGLPDFVEFMAKDRAQYKRPLRDGIAWLDSYALQNFGARFIDIEEQQQLAICDEIAYPDVQEDALQPGIAFFTLMRNMTLTGYYTTELGFRDLGYQGNTPNIWDGVPEAVLARHGKSYDAEWLAKCVDQTRRDITAEWDDEMNLIT